MQDCGFADARLEDECVPEGRDEEAWYFLRSPAFEPLIVLLLLRTNGKDGETCWGQESDVADLRNRATLAMAVEVSPSAPNPIAIADATGRKASATSWAAFVTLHLSDPGR